MWRFAAARATGTSHRKIGLPCQDHFRCLLVDESIFVASVADGAGSAELAELGAKIATDTLVEIASSAVMNGRTDFAAILREAAAEAREAIVSTAYARRTMPRDLASTLLAIIVGPQGGAAIQIGDGVIVIRDGADDWSWVFWPQRGEYANTTHFLTDDDATTLLQAKRFAAPVHDVALMSDGLEPLALHYATRTAHVPFFDTLFAPLCEAAVDQEVCPLSAEFEAFLHSPRVTARTDDDLSLVLATCRIDRALPKCR